MRCEMKSWDARLKYFSEDELKCQGTGVIKLDIRFAKALPLLREEWGKPLIVTSVCRTPEHNKNVGGHPNSLHLTENPKHDTWGTMAADIYWKNWSTEEKKRFAKFAYSRGFSIGLNDTFCHIDLRKEIGLYQAVFNYGSNWSNQFSRKDII